MHPTFRRSLASLLAITLAAPALPLHAAEPAVKGPESVAAWYDGGQQFIRDAKQVLPNVRRAENIIAALESELYFYGRVLSFKPADDLKPIPIDNL